MVSNAIQKFKELVSTEKTRIASLSPLILVFGGAIDVKNPYASCRNVFLDWAHSTNHELAKFLIAPESYPEWNQFEGYDNLVDFERDAGCLSRGILLFSECAGALAELGAFCMDDILCERLLVVVEKKHYDDHSFIKLGPIRRIEEAHSSEAICVVETTSSPKQFSSQASGVGDALSERVKAQHKTQKFDATRTRDQFLLIADLVELFGVLTKKEIEGLLEFMGVEHEPKRIKRMLNLLAMFKLVIQHEHLTSRYYVPPKNRNTFLDYSASEGGNFDRTRFKLTVAQPALNADASRLKAIEKVHGVSK